MSPETQAVDKDQWESAVVFCRAIHLISTAVCMCDSQGHREEMPRCRDVLLELLYVTYVIIESTLGITGPWTSWFSATPQAMQVVQKQIWQ